MTKGASAGKCCRTSGAGRTFQADTSEAGGAKLGQHILALADQLIAQGFLLARQVWVAEERKQAAVEAVQLGAQGGALPGLREGTGQVVEQPAGEAGLGRLVQLCWPQG
jgi:hypothetical protein